MKDKLFDDLILLGHDVVEQAGEDAEAESLPALRKKKGDVFYSELIHALMNIKLPEEEAKNRWKEIVKHKWYMSEQLKRNVGIRVAALDYFLNLKGLIKTPKIVEVKEFADISWKAVTDSLTGLYNHRHFQTAVNRELKRAVEEGGVFSVIMLDIDFFKIYNDSNGHVAGDVVLVETSNIIKKHSRPGDIPSRYGGEEFGIVLPGTRKTDALEIAERIRTELNSNGFANEEVMPLGKVTLSGGISAGPEDGGTRQDIVNAADERLYRAKRSGRDRICCE